MNDHARRKELVAEYKRTLPEAGVYRIVNTQTGRVLLGSSTNLESMRNKMTFARSTNSPGALDYRLHKDIKEYGLESFRLDVLDVLDNKSEMTDARIRNDLAALEDLWREQLGSADFY